MWGGGAVWRVKTGRGKVQIKKEKVLREKPIPNVKNNDARKATKRNTFIECESFQFNPICNCLECNRC